MTTQLIQSMQQAIEAWDACGRYPDSTSDIEHLDVAINALRTAIQQAEAKTDEPVAWPVWCVATGEQVNGVETYTHHDEYVPLADCFALYTHPAPGVPNDVVRDAERYRWLRDSDHWPAPFASSQEPEPVRGTDLDSAIDAAMLAAQAQKGQQ